MNHQVAPQFVSILQDTTEETLTAILRKLNAPEEAIELLGCMRVLSQYQEHAAKETDLQFIGIEDTVIQTINLNAQCGGVFHSEKGISVSMPSVFVEAK